MKVGLLLTALAGATILVGGCAVVPMGDPYYDAPVVRVAPPPPQYEYYGAPPAPVPYSPPRMDRDERNGRGRDDRRDELRKRHEDRDGDGRPDFR